MLAFSFARFVNDTGSSNTDKITTDSTITGNIAPGGMVMSVEIDTNNDGIANFTTTAMGSTFQYTPWLPSGPATIRARTVGMSMPGPGMEYGDWASLSFTVGTR